MFCKDLQLRIGLLAVLACFLFAGLCKAKPVRIPAEDFLIPTAKSIVRFESRLEKNPSDHRSAVALARLYMRRAKENDDFDSFLDAERVLRKSKKLSPGQPTVDAFLAESLMAQHRFREAKSIAEKVLAKHKQFPMSLATLGDAHMQLGQYQQARSCYEQLKKLSDSPAVLVRLARYYEVIGEGKRAISLVATALEKQSAVYGLKSVEAWYNWRLAKLYLGSGELEQAVPLLKRALVLNPRDSESLALLAKIQLIQQNSKLAISNYQKAISIAEKPPYLIGLGTVYEKIGETKKAAECFDLARGLMADESKHPKAGPAHARERAKFLLRQNEELELALELTQKDYEMRPDLFSSDILAWAFYKNGKLDKAKISIDRALGVNPKMPMLLYHSGMIEAELGNIALARKRLASALEFNPYFDPVDVEIAKEKLAALQKR